MARLFHFPFAFPPRGLALTFLVALYLLPGLVGHDPWKSEDATHFGVVYSLLKDGSWLVPHLAGDPWYGPPLYYWLGALTASLTSWFLPLHDGVRLASGLCSALFILAVGNAAAEFYGAAHRRLSMYVAIGCMGLLAHAHEIQPGLATLAALAGMWWGISLMPRLHRHGTLIAGISFGAVFLAAGLPGLMLAVPIFLAPLLIPAWRNRNMFGGTLAALVTGAILASLWLIALRLIHPVYLAQWWDQQLGAFGYFSGNYPALLSNLGRYLNLLTWYAWPALPLAFWALWKERRNLGQAGILLPFVAFAITLVVLSVRHDARSVTTLPLLLPLILLATPAAGRLRRGAANAYAWFGMMTFSLAIALVWLIWVAMVFGVPPRIAANLARLEPGFVMPFQPWAVMFATLLSVAWLWLIFSAPRRVPERGTVLWAAGMTTIWAMIMLLWLPGLDYAKTYRPMMRDLSAHLPTNSGCISSRGLGSAQRASLHYFVGTVTRQETNHTEPSCKLLLVQAPGISPTTGWDKLWEGHRSSDRDERFQLFRRIQP